MLRYQTLLFSDKGGTIQEQFDEFHRLNPWVLNELVGMMREYRSMGRHKVGIKHLVEVIRWNYAKATSGSEFKINNNFTSRYARLIRLRHPDLAGMFNTRELKAA